MGYARPPGANPALVLVLVVSGFAAAGGLAWLAVGTGREPAPEPSPARPAATKPAPDLLLQDARNAIVALGGRKWLDR